MTVSNHIGKMLIYTSINSLTGSDIFKSSGVVTKIKYTKNGLVYMLGDGYYDHIEQIYYNKLSVYVVKHNDIIDYIDSDTISITAIHKVKDDSTQ